MNIANKLSAATTGSLLPLDLWARLDRITTRLPTRWSAWLNCDELLCDRVAREAGAPARVRLLDERVGLLSVEQRELLGAQTDGALLRQVEVAAGGRIYVYAETLIPDATLEAHPWLAELGERPLPDALSWRDDVVYGSREVAALPAEHPVAARALSRIHGSAQTVWARRSVVAISRQPILMTEVFLIEAKSA
jgi:chorismate-pyruvate lyase